MSLEGLIVLDAKGNRYRLVPDSTKPTGKAAITLPNLIKSQKQLSAARESSNDEFRLKLKNLREGAKISQTTLAKAAGTKQPNIAAIEMGRRVARQTTRDSLIAAWERLSKKAWK